MGAPPPPLHEQLPIELLGDEDQPVDVERRLHALKFDRDMAVLSRDAAQLALAETQRALAETVVKHIKEIDKLKSMRLAAFNSRSKEFDDLKAALERLTAENAALRVENAALRAGALGAGAAGQ
jgi:hypothetical protein